MLKLTPLVAMALFLLAGVSSAMKFEKLNYKEFRKTGGNSYVRLSDGWTNYELAGDSTSEHIVVLIHGGTIPLCIWDAQMEDFHNAGIRTLRYDQYGRGYSARPDTVYSRDLFLRQLKDLLDALSITQPVHIIGPSFGGAVAINFAAHYPERVRSIILVSPALNLINSNSPLAGYIKILKKQGLGEFLYHLFVRGKLVRRGRSYIPGGKGSLCDETFMNQFMCKGTEHAFFSMFRSDAYGDYRELTRKAGKEIKDMILIRGNEDKEITESMIAEIQEDLPDIPYQEIEKSGHVPGSDAAKIFNSLIIDFIKSR